MANLKGYKKKLSKHLLEMKFMQRTALGGEAESEATQSVHIDDDHWVRDLPDMPESKNAFIQEPGFVLCEELGFGRMSYKGFNPDIEKLMQFKQQENDLELAEARENEISVDDEEFAERYNSLVGTIFKKFANKKKRKADLEEDDVGDEGEEDQRRPSTSSVPQNGSTSQASTSQRKKHRTFKKPADD